MTQTAKKGESPLLSILINIVTPSLVLMKFSGEDKFGPVNALLVALAFPVLYGAYGFFRSRKFDFIPILGFVSVLLTGVIGLLALDAQWIAVKEAAVPALIGLAVLVSLYTPAPLVKKILLNDRLLNMQAIEAKITERDAQPVFEQRVKSASLLVAASFFLSSALNYGLAVVLLTAEPGTPAFNEQLGEMTALSFPVIALPSTFCLLFALWWLIKGLREVTGLAFEEMLNLPKE